MHGFMWYSQFSLQSRNIATRFVCSIWGIITYDNEKVQFSSSYFFFVS